MGNTGTVQVREPPKASSGTKPLSLRNSRWLFVLTVLACAVIWMARGIYVYWDNPNLINFLAAWIPSIISGLLAFAPIHEMSTPKKWAWRVCVMAVGIAWSAVLWHQQVIADKVALEQQKKIVTEAVQQSNQHADQQIQGVKNDINKAMSQMVSTSTEAITSKLGAIKPSAPVKTPMQFTLWPHYISGEPILKKGLTPDKDGIFTVECTYLNVSDARAENIDVWISICDMCEFAAEPEGYDRPPGSAVQTRHRSIPSLNPGTGVAVTTLKIRPKLQTSSFDLNFRYACQTCGKGDTKQTATITVLPSKQSP